MSDVLRPRFVVCRGTLLLFVALAAKAAAWDVVTVDDKVTARPNMVVPAGPLLVYGGTLARALDASGSIWSVPIPFEQVDGSPSMAIVNGHPALAYVGSGGVKYVRAEDPGGSRWGLPIVVIPRSQVQTTELLSLAVVAGSPSIACISGRAGTFDETLFSRGLDPDGSAWSTPVSIGSTSESAGIMAEVAGRPAIVFGGSDGIHYVRALDPLGSAWGADSRIAASGTIGRSLTIVDGHPAICYSSYPAHDELVFLRAADAEGNAWDAPVVVAAPQAYVSSSSLTIIQGRPAIAYEDLGIPRELKYVPALDVQGATWAAPQLVDADGISLGLGTLAEVEGEPAISYLRNYTTVRYAFGGDLPIALLPVTLPDGKVGRWYAETVAAHGGQEPYAYTVTGGALPPGLALTSDGVVSGTPTSAGLHRVTILATDAPGAAVSRDYGLLVRDERRAFLAGQGLGAPNPNRVRVLDEAGAPTPVDFMAYGAATWGVNVVAADVLVDGHDDILTGVGPGSVHGPHVRAFERDGVPVASVSFFAYGTPRFGVNVAAGRLDDDPESEVLSGAGPGAVFGPHVRGWDLDASGQILPIGAVSYFAYGTLKYGANVGCGDLDADGYGEILTGPGPGPSFAAQVRGWQYDGSWLSPFAGVSFLAYPGTHGVRAAAGDLYGNPGAEIATAPGPGPSAGPRIRVFAHEYGVIFPLTGADVFPASTAYGGRVDAGDVSGDAYAEVIASLGPDPSAAATIHPYVYDTNADALLPGPVVDGFPGETYGASATAGALVP